MNTYKAITKTVAGMDTATEFSDFYTADTMQAAADLWDEDCHRYGLPMDKTSVTFQQVDSDLKPMDGAWKYDITTKTFGQ